MEVRVEADRGWAWAAYLFWFVRALAVGAVVGAVGVASGGLRPGEAVVGISGLVVAAAVALGTPTALWWRLGPGRVGYVVRDGQLLVLRGSRVLRGFPCPEITDLRMHGALTWKELLLRNWFNAWIEGWPTLSVEVKEQPEFRLLVGPQDQPGILLWGAERVRRAERDLRRAVVREGAALSAAG